MTVQEHVILTTQNVANEFFRYMEEIPIDKIEWKPLGSGQSALSMAQEIGITPTWAMMTVNDIPFGDNPSTEYRRSWKTVQECQRQFQDRFVGWSDFVMALNDDDLKRTKFLPLNGGREHTFLELLDYPRWNITWHMGQVAYIQTLYGDRDMYWV